MADDLIQRLTEWLRKRGEPDSGIRYEAGSHSNTRGVRHSLSLVELHGSDADFIAKHFHGQGARDLAAELTRLTAGEPVAPGKYDDVLQPFLRMMEQELHANTGKGDRPGWMQMSRETVLLEIHYHLAKLQKAALTGDDAGVSEYAADVANMSMMLADICGLLLVSP